MSETTRALLDDAISAIDAALGKGCAREHPELIAAFIQAERLSEIGTHLKYLGTGDAATTMGAIEFLASRIGEAITEGSSELGSRIGSRIGEAIEEGLHEVARQIDFSEIADAIEPVQRDDAVVLRPRSADGKEERK
jgi:hypothetical protein